MEDTEVQPIVIDVGSSSIKAGFGGDDAPRTLFPCIIGKPKYHRAMLLPEHKESYIGWDAMERRGILSLDYPVKNGVIQDWDIMQQLWQASFDELRVDPSNAPILLTEVPHNPKYNRERMLQIMFEEYNTPASYIALQAHLAVYATGRSVALVLDVGEGVTHIVPVYEGYTDRASVTRVDFAGRHVTDHLMNLLNQQGHSFHTSAEREIVRDIKEKLAYVALDYNWEKAQPSTYILPDGQEITLTNEKYECSEILFSPFLVGHSFCGIHEMILNSIMACDVDIRKNFFHNICISGGSTLIPGLQQRLHREISMKSPHHRCHIVAPPERKYLTWIGGSILASLSTFQQAWISREEYDEIGPEMAHKKSYSARYQGPEARYSL